MKRALWLLPLLVLLLVHAGLYGAVCDDAYIALRYARHLAESGQLVYNLGERVEGFTSPLWVLLAAPFLGLGVGAETTVRVLGALSAALLLVATASLLRRVLPARSGWGLVACAWLAGSAPVAAWSCAGLETILFGAWITLGVALALPCPEQLDVRRAARTGVCFGLAALTRPEAALVFACTFGVVAVAALRSSRSARPLRSLGAMLGPFVVLVGAYELFRVSYFGEPLPNTFYVKTSGDRAAAFAQGLEYLRVAGTQLGWLALGLVAPALPYRTLFGELVTAELRRLALIGRLLVPAYLAYVASVGGDFLDLARFLVPLAPLAACLLVAALGLALVRLGRGRALALGLGAATALHLGWQIRVGSRALQVADPDKSAIGLEPFGWTKWKAKQWAATGRWLAAHARPDDWMAVGAAGAMPYYAGISNLDTFGLCDAYVARHGLVLGARPGHQRWAPTAYVLSRRPTFLFVGDQLTDAAIPLPRSRPFGPNYVWLQAIVRADRHGAPRTFFHTLLVRRDRAKQLRSSPDVMEPDRS